MASLKNLAQMEVRDLAQQYVVREVLNRPGVTDDKAPDGCNRAAHDPG